MIFISQINMKLDSNHVVFFCLQIIWQQYVKNGWYVFNQSDALPREELLNREDTVKNGSKRWDDKSFLLTLCESSSEGTSWLLHHLPFHIYSVNLIILYRNVFAQTFWSKAKVSDSCLYIYDGKEEKSWVEIWPLLS